MLINKVMALFWQVLLQLVARCAIAKVLPNRLLTKARDEAVNSNILRALHLGTEITCRPEVHKTLIAVRNVHSLSRVKAGNRLTNYLIVPLAVIEFISVSKASSVVDNIDEH